MALKRAYTNGKATQLVANGDVLSEQIDIQSMIKTVRGQQVMLDRDLATLYGVENRVLNQAVKRNSERFPEDFMFQLNKAEDDDLKSQNVTSSWGGRRKLAYAFTEQGIAMLSSVLRSPMAIDVNIRIMRAFVAMRRFIISNAQLFQRIEIKQFSRAHDRFLLIDDEVFHIGASIKDLGKKWFGFTLMRDITTNELINKIQE